MNGMIIYWIQVSEFENTTIESLCCIEVTVLQKKKKEKRRSHDQLCQFYIQSPLFCDQTSSGEESIFIFWFNGHSLDECSGLIDGFNEC